MHKGKPVTVTKKKPLRKNNIIVRVEGGPELEIDPSLIK